MKRILIFSLAYVPYAGGAELAIKEITDRLDPDEFAFDMITLRFDRKLPAVETIGNITVHRIGFAAEDVKVSDRALPLSCRLAKFLFPFTSFFKALSLHRRTKYDLIWAMMANQAGFGALFFSASLKLRRTGKRVPYFLELQDGTPLARVRSRRPITTLLWPLYRAIYRKADVIKAISSFIKDLAREAGYAGRIEVIPNGVDVTQFSAPVPDDELAELKAKVGKKMGDVLLFTASRLVLSRGVEDIIRALAHLPPHVKLLIAGDGEDRKKLDDIARQSGVAERVMFAGHIAHADIPNRLKISDIFVRPSIIEGMGSAFVEAFAAGVPVVATPVGGIPDFLSDPDRNPDEEPTGLFCNVRDPESIARAVKRYMDDPVLAARIVKNAKELATQKYDWNIVARDMREKIFERLI
ncbi:hypothetical protein A3C21_02790 [Candidatus Kaiserbacteria bacterium RIFCSPHIGHO2_02_FULL_59_21]|uniref:Glycosyl transferase family 1 domain-containing protein n=1 Tax=Candidatus Kaiserbacteria bacterium RIFCSPHIGHO2_02_FULL_59_21 TaxID=1798500 RepID=A0A1F6DYV6_9BACT|nr:MAG: hypothetical protein A2766_04305 [Candidatus Kaiserbacteria bacterium RIFCSPHIGHO2_01_FULL_58_22]OGG66576.1 MAG: hypothetical protein A3C21_02790 [Candidatus Kaiserbacteria bacterium RIFCSPHIGHO2_02_FULL_59_21]OGG80058.1 MAG: hypothetical protein A2952_01785 [Candidatus Kaiserbacteria bacterium RIFCSPLOWO2_01_FULL_59_34]OGG86414.1 MAG: hypothetical protein A3I47_01645 [Candidatus Kaiserbacteria bacterium RIFCSPLOWO2_02_FULL_59_19]